MPLPHSSELRARTGALVCLALVLLAVLWPSGADVAATKNALGLWLPSAEVRDVVLNLVMLAPVTFQATLGWPRVPWWAWALLGCGLGLGAELIQLVAPGLDRRPSWENVAQNAVGAWAGAFLGLVVLRRLERRRASRSPRPPR